MTARDERRAFGWRFTAPLLLAAALNPMNSSMLATGLTDIGREFAVSPGAAAALVSVLYLCSAIANPAVGRLGAVFGARRVFAVGLGIVMLGGLVGAFAPSFGWLVLSRALIGIGTSAAFPTSMTLVRARADRAELETPTRTLGLFSIAAQVSLVIGLPLGGLLTGLLGWRWLFAVNVPLAVIALVAVLRWVDRDPPRTPRPPRALLAELDLPGIALFGATTAGLLLFLVDLESPRWWLLGATAALGILLIVWERRSSSPLIDVRFLASAPPLARTYLRQLLTGLAVFTAFYGLSQWMGATAGLGAAAIGVILLPLSVVSVVLARLVSVRGWVRGALIGGAIGLIAAGGMLLLVHAEAPALVASLVAVAVVYGIAYGLTTVATQTAMYIQSPADQIGTAAGLLRTSNYLGAIFSASVIAVTFGDVPTNAGLHAQGWVVAALGAALLLLTFDRRLPWRAG
ncbi:MFS transporter [Microbacterium sp. 2FI]|uniref:MFS transporter n=1 Tax=Microbacterium sp. 2FI TaxID=2502193 RepID=UPI0010F44AC7|nr:MFS transporter [Microbacterium sp. 2FI]